MEKIKGRESDPQVVRKISGPPAGDSTSPPDFRTKMIGFLHRRNKPIQPNLSKKAGFFGNRLLGKFTSLRGQNQKKSQTDYGEGASYKLYQGRGLI